MPPERTKDIQQRLHELNAEEARFLADIQVSLAGIERTHAQRRMEELTLVELQRKAEDDGRETREREDRKLRTTQKNQGRQGKQGQAGNKKRGAEEWHKRPEPAKRQRRRGPSNAYGGQGIPVPIPGPSNYGNWNQRQNHTLPGGECKCSRVDVHCGGNGSTCQICKALGCAGIAQPHYRNRKRDSEHHGNVPRVASAASTWPHDAASVINIDADILDSQG